MIADASCHDEVSRARAFRTIDGDRSQSAHGTPRRCPSRMAASTQSIRRDVLSRRDRSYRECVLAAGGHDLFCVWDSNGHNAFARIAHAITGSSFLPIRLSSKSLADAGVTHIDPVDSRPRLYLWQSIANSISAFPRRRIFICVSFAGNVPGTRVTGDDHTARARKLATVLESVSDAEFRRGPPGGLKRSSPGFAGVIASLLCRCILKRNQEIKLRAGGVRDVLHCGSSLGSLIS
jgi:hypothetical protein